MTRLTAFVLISAALLGSTSFGAQVCTDMPASVSATVNANFDGSFTYGDPKLFVNGKYMVINGSDVDYGKSVARATGAEGFCNILSKKFIWFKDSGKVPDQKEWVSLRWDGSVAGIGNSYGDPSIISEIICK